MKHINRRLKHLHQRNAKILKFKKKLSKIDQIVLKVSSIQKINVENLKFLHKCHFVVIPSPISIQRFDGQRLEVIRILQILIHKFLEFFPSTLVAFDWWLNMKIIEITWNINVLLGESENSAYKENATKSFNEKIIEIYILWKFTIPLQF